ncbi:MAG TPA: MFS transporter [Gemmatimonadales bacterium]|nr:MFS transporter [Gemmatimonadales bacterium]
MTDAAAPDPGSRPWRWSWILALSGGVAVAFGSMFYAMSVLLTEEAAGGRFSTTALSLAYGGFVLAGGGSAYWIGKQADRRGVRPLIVLGFALGSAGLVAFGRATEPWQVVAASWLLLGPAGGLTFYEPAFVAVDQWFGARHRARALAVLTVVGGLAGPIFLPGTEALVGALGWRDTTLVLAAAMALAGLVAAMLLPRVRPHRTDEALPAPPSPRLGRDRRFVLFTAAMALSFGAFQTVFFHRIAAFEEAGFAVASVTAWAAVSSLLSFPGRYVGPYLAERLGGIPIYAGTVAVAGAAVLFMLGQSSWMMPTHFGVFGLAFGALLPIRAVVMAGWYSGPAYGRIMGAQWSLAAVTGAIMPALAGVLRDAAGTYRPAVWVTVGLFTGAGVAAMLSRKRGTSRNA